MMEGKHPPRFGKYYGSTTVSERGQIVIPAEARREKGLEAGTKLLIFGRGGEGGPLTLMTAEMVTEFVRHAMERVSELESMLKEVPGAEEE
ncbi:MAG TPA: AbrB family transcriptional regulator [Chloroflexi bacterium]|nr:AbrB family transcriptional regulator [Chloroflexota bacterium]